jgi:hypothetical protein
MEMFPERNLDVVVEAVKRCNFSLTDATQYGLLLYQLEASSLDVGLSSFSNY